MALARSSGGWTAPKENSAPADALKGQLYDMKLDPSETNNLYASEPEIVNKLLSLLEADVRRGRSTDGTESKNDITEIVLWKSEQGKSRGNKTNR